MRRLGIVVFELFLGFFKPINACRGSVKLARRVETFSQSVSDLLTDSHFIHDSKIMQLRVKRSTKALGLVLQLTSRGRRGNRFKRKVPWAHYLEASYGKIVRNSSMAEHLEVGKSTVKHMQVMVSAAYMNAQALFLAKLISWCSRDPPLLCIRHAKWDETQLLCSMNADKSMHRVRSTWQVLVCRLRLVLSWKDGRNMIIRLVLPPVSLLSTGAECQYYTLNYHPAYRCVNGLLKLLRKHADENMDVCETDGASSNTRLLAHMLQQSKTSVFAPEKSGPSLLFAHARCMNHAVQLNNAALLALVNPGMLNRVYGMAVFLRNLGYWMRVRQSCRHWIEVNLNFRREIHSANIGQEVQSHPALVELLSYLQMWKRLDKQTRVVDGVETTESAEEISSFDRKVKAFSDMWNGDITKGPTHICSSEHVPMSERHCQDRAHAVRKATDSFLELFAHAMPEVPSPSKWSKLFSPMDFVLSGVVVHNWLENVFGEAFAEMTFQEYENAPDAALDPRLVETLSFHMVNGRRLRSAQDFLNDKHAKWSACLLTVAMEPNRVLTFHWLKCLGTSLCPGKRPPLFSLLDPHASVLTSLLQHYSMLLSTTSGSGCRNLSPNSRNRLSSLQTFLHSLRLSGSVLVLCFWFMLAML